MPASGCVGNVELIANLLIRQPVTDQLQHLAFALRQLQWALLMSNSDRHESWVVVLE